MPKITKILIIVTIVLILALLVTLFIVCFSGGNTSGGNSKPACKNCGRTPVYGAGLCKTCYKGFMEWRDKNGY